VGVLWAGGVVGVATIITSAVDAVSAPVALAMAASSMSAMAAGLVGWTLPGARTAWRRGYRQGLEAGKATPRPNAEVSPLPRQRWSKP
jgi:ABC-type sugar transport system substrate-binding protein